MYFRIRNCWEACRKRGAREQILASFKVWELEIQPAVLTVQLRTGQQSLGSQFLLLQDIALVFWRIGLRNKCLLAATLPALACEGRGRSQWQDQVTP